jgi:predicted permease
MMKYGLREWLEKFRGLFHKRALEEELDAELASHLDLATEEYLERGMTLEEARRMARIRMGGMEQVKEEQREARGLPTMESMVQDVKYALRTFVRDRGFAIFAVLIIALGIGASATVFSIIDALLAKPLPFHDPSRLVWIANRTKTEGDLSGATVQVGRMLDFRERNKSFADVAGYFAFYGTGDSRLTGNGEPERLSTVPVSCNFFPLLGIKPMLGKQFTADECKWNGPNVVMLSHGLWVRRFGSDPTVIGRVIRLNDTDTTIIGILPESFDFAAIFAPGTQIDLFNPFPLTKETDRWGNTLAIVGRLKPDAELKKAQAEADLLGLQITRENQRANGLDPKLTFLADHISGRVRGALAVLGSAVVVMMLIVCANLSNLLLARTATRQREIAVRIALGAGRMRLIRQLLTESVLLSCAGALLGLAFTFAWTRGVSHLNAFNIPLLSNVRVNSEVLYFTIVAAIVTGVIVGIAPALQTASLSVTATMGQRGASETKGHVWTRSTLVVLEMALACVLLVAAGLFVRSFVRLLEVDPGFQPESAATWRVDPNAQYKTQDQQNAYFDEVLRRARSIPGVKAAGLSDVLPLGHNRSWGAGAKGKQYKESEYPLAFVRVVSDGYLSAMGIPLKKGRDFSERDRQKGAKPVMVINESMARTLWPGEDAIGKVVARDCGADREVIGVVGDVRHIALEQGSGSEMYLPIRQCQDWGSVELVIRSNLPVQTLSARVEEALRPLIPDLPHKSMRPLTELVQRAVSPRRLIALLLTGFAGFALVLVTLGIYALISYSVARRTQEIGIRMALGAPAGRVRGQIVLQTLGLAAAGLSIGVFAAFLLARALHSLLFGVTYRDPATFVLSLLSMFGVALLAGYVPARRASRIDPAIALRTE